MSISEVAVKDSTLMAINEVNAASGDKLATSFSQDLVAVEIYVTDGAAGEKILRKGGPSVMKSDLLVINRTDLVPFVGSSLEVMQDDARRSPGNAPFVFTDLRQGSGPEHMVDCGIEMADVA